MTQNGTHTWNLNLHYQRCPSCNYIFENRQAFENRLGTYQKDLECPRCHHQFTITKNVHIQPGPFIGEGDKAEMNWS